MPDPIDPIDPVSQPPTSHAAQTGGFAADSPAPESRLPAHVNSIECPGCGAKLRNVAAQPGIKMRCLNCGIRFAPVINDDPANPGAVAATFQEESKQEKESEVREPKAAGYWLLRLPAILYCIATSIGFVVACWIFVSEMSYRLRYSNLTDFLPLAYFPLMPLSGFLAFMVTRSLGRLEAATLKAAWKHKLIEKPIPATKGSSLPYLLPLGAGPAIIFLSAVLRSTSGDYSSREFAIAFGMISFVTFILAFMFDDLRQFLWRQIAIADTCAENVSTQPVTPRDATLPPLAVIPALAIVSLACLVATASYNDYENTFRWNRNPLISDDQFFIFTQLGMVVACILGIAITVFLTGRNAIRANQAWWRAAASTPAHPHIALPHRETPDVPAKLVRVLLTLFAATGAVTLLLTILRHATFRGAEAFIPCFAIAAGLFVCGTLSRLYTDVRQWRQLQHNFWTLRNNADSIPRLSAIINTGILLTTSMALFEALFFMIALANDVWRGSINFEEFMVVPLAGFGVHFPIIWVALVCREFFLAEALAEKLTAPQAESAT